MKKRLADSLRQVDKGLIKPVPKSDATKVRQFVASLPRRRRPFIAATIASAAATAARLDANSVPIADEFGLMMRAVIAVA